MNTVFFPSCPVSLDSFEYSQETPTRYTEALSFQCLTILDGLATNGGCLFVETSTPEEQNSAVSSWLAEFNTWLADIEGSVSSWLSGNESRALPVLAAAPALPALIGGASIVLFKGVLVKMGIDVLSSLVRISQSAVANRRQAQLVRLIDKAFMNSSWFGLSSESKIDTLNVNLSQINESVGRVASRLTVDDKNYNYQGIGQALYDCLTVWWPPDSEGNISGFDSIADLIKLLQKDSNVIRLLSKIILTHGGDINEHEFVLAGEDS